MVSEQFSIQEDLESSSMAEHKDLPTLTLILPVVSQRSSAMVTAVSSLPNSPAVSMKLDRTNFLIWRD